MNEEELDRRLRLALEETTAPEAVTRLETFWRRQQRVERCRRMARRCVAMAASAAVVAGLLWRPFGDGERLEQPMAVRPSTSDSKVDSAAAPETLLTKEHPAIESRSVGREPTAYERLMFTAQVQREQAAATSRLASELDAAIERLAANAQSPSAQIGDVASPDLARSGLVGDLLVESPGFEAMVLERLPRLRGAKASAAIGLLARHGSPRSMSALLAAARNETLRSEAIAAIEQVAGVDGMSAGVQRSNDRGVRRALVERLLAMNSDAALRSYLSLVSNPAVRADALAAADAMESPPLEGLFRLLKDDDREIRLSAAMTLGFVNGPRVTQGLIAIVMEDPAAPTETWLALLACRDESAERFLADASQQPRLLGRVNYARTMWAQVLP